MYSTRGAFVELRDYLRIARWRWRTVIGCVAALVAAAVIVTLNMTPQYASSAQLLVSPATRQDAQAYQGAQFTDMVTSYAELATGQDMAIRVIQALHLQMTPTELADRIRATATPNTAIITVTATDPRPAEAQLLAQVYAEQLSQYVAATATLPGGQPAPIQATVAASSALPTKPVSPRPDVNLGLGLVIGLLLGFGLAVVRELLDTSIKTAQDVSQVVDTPVRATISFDSTARDRPLITQLASDAPRAEAFRVLRTNLQLPAGDGSRVLVVSSPGPGEGRTSTAANLAIALMETGRRVLLVDADLRRPTIAHDMSLESSVGLTSVLAGRVALGKAVQHPTGMPGLAVLTSGALASNPSELLQSNAMSDVIAEMRADFEVVILDTPPLLPVTDAAVVAAHSDGALLVVCHGKTTRDQLADGTARLDAVEAHCIGVVLNMAPRSHARGRSRSHDYQHAKGSRARAARVTGRRAWTAEAAPRDDEPGVSTAIEFGRRVAAPSKGASAISPLGSRRLSPIAQSNRQGTLREEGSPSSTDR